jgi:hypothetical protein
MVDLICAHWPLSSIVTITRRYGHADHFTCAALSIVSIRSFILFLHNLQENTIFQAGHLRSPSPFYILRWIYLRSDPPSTATTPQLPFVLLLKLSFGHYQY